MGNSIGYDGYVLELYPFQCCNIWDSLGYDVHSVGTENHLDLLDLRNKHLTGKTQLEEQRHVTVCAT